MYEKDVIEDYDDVFNRGFSTILFNTKLENDIHKRSVDDFLYLEYEYPEIYAKAYNRDPEFYRFLKTMEIYGSTLDADTLLLLGTDGDLMRYLQKAK